MKMRSYMLSFVLALFAFGANAASLSVGNVDIWYDDDLEELWDITATDSSLTFTPTSAASASVKGSGVRNSKFRDSVMFSIAAQDGFQLDTLSLLAEGDYLRDLGGSAENKLGVRAKASLDVYRGRREFSDTAKIGPKDPELAPTDSLKDWSIGLERDVEAEGEWYVKAKILLQAFSKRTAGEAEISLASLVFNFATSPSGSSGGGNPVPVPAALWLMMSAISGVGLFSRRGTVAA